MRDDRGRSQSPRTLLWASVGLLIIGAAIGSPVGSSGITIVAALCAIAPVAAGSTRVRILGLIVLLAAVALTTMTFPTARHDMQRYRDRAATSRPAEQDTPRRSPQREDGRR